MRLAVIKAGKCLSQSDPDNALELLLAAFRSSRHVCQNGGIMRRIHGFSTHTTVCSGLVSWACHPDTTSAHLKKAIATLSQDYEGMTVPFSVTLKIEHLALKNFLDSFENQGGGFHENSMVDHTMIFLMGEPDYSASLLSHVLKNQLQGVDSSWGKRPAFVPGNDLLFDISAPSPQTLSGTDLSELMQLVSLIDLLAGIPRLQHLLICTDNERCTQATMIAVLAVQHFVRLHGRLPESINECAYSIPGKSFPDPRQPNDKPLRFSTDGEHAVVYSIGLDGVDNSYAPDPTVGDRRGSWSQLRNPDGQFEGYRIPLWRPVSADDKAASVEPDNVQN